MAEAGAAADAADADIANGFSRRLETLPPRRSRRRAADARIAGSAAEREAVLAPPGGLAGGRSWVANSRAGAGKAARPSSAIHSHCLSANARAHPLIYTSLLKANL